jgi:predicted metal-dependent phosphoesterase TrpH
MVKIDLHTHSTRSDGLDSPSELLDNAAAAGISVLALTDHDTVSGWDEARVRASSLGIGFVPGIEVTSVSEVERFGRKMRISVHLLAYLPDPDHKALEIVLGDTVATRETRGRAIVEKLAEQIPITWEMVLDHLDNGATIGRPAIADTLVTMGLVPDRSAAFDYYLSTDGPFYVSHSAVSTLDAIGLIRASGAVPVIAHPLKGVGPNTDPEDLPIAHFEQMIEAGLQGVEVYHRDVPEAARKWLLELANKHNLVITGSSDYHGLEGKPNRLGENTTAQEMLDRIIELGTGTPASL